MPLTNLPQIVQLARRQVGEHYLWGGRGEIPGGGTACSLPSRNVRMAPDSFDPRAPIVRTAFHPVFDASCAGRWGAKPGGRPFNPRDTDLIGYLEQQKFKPPESVQDYFGFTPRRVSGGHYTDTALVWGEPCDGKRHFDCVGFLNWISRTPSGRRSSGTSPITGRSTLRGASRWSRSTSTRSHTGCCRATSR